MNVDLCLCTYNKQSLNSLSTLVVGYILCGAQPQVDMKPIKRQKCHSSIVGNAILNFQSIYLSSHSNEYKASRCRVNMETMNVLYRNYGLLK